MKILAVNPWVYDFTYYDLYAKPYGLLIVATLLEKMGHKIDFLDLCYCENYDNRFTTKRKSDGTGAFYKEEVAPPDAYSHRNKKYFKFGLPEEYAVKLLKEKEKPDIILITSIMTYWYLGVRETIRLIKNIFPHTPVYLGGIYATLLWEHALRNSGADFVIKGESKNFFLEVLNVLPPRSLVLPKLEIFYNKLYYIPLLTSFGCPFNCKYCASKTIYNGLLTTLSPRECFEYILKYTEYYKTDIVAFYDDALLYNKEKHLYELLSLVIKSGRRLKFYTPNGLHVRFIDERCAELLKAAGFQKIRLSLEFLENKGYDNKTNTKEFERAMSYLHKAGFKQREIGVYLLCGIEGQKKDDLKEAIDYVYNRGGYPYLSEYSPVPGTELFDKQMLKSRYDLSEPLYHNNSLLPMENDNFTYEDFLELKSYNRSKRREFQ